MLVMVFTATAHTAVITAHAEDKATVRQKSETSEATHSIVDQIKALAQALGIAWGGPTM